MPSQPHYNIFPVFFQAVIMIFYHIYKYLGGSVSVIRKSAALLLLLSLLLHSAGGLSVHAVPTVEGTLSEGLLACAETIDLSACGVTVEELCAAYTRLLHGTPELFHVAPRLSFTTREEEGERWVVEVYPVYTLTGTDLTAARSFYRHTLTAILSEMEETFGGRTPAEAEIVLYLHDVLADRYAYDTRPASASTPDANAYTLFRDGVGICQAYALAFMALARGAGLEADFVASEAMDHAWNHVRVDGVWYHVDVTRDDPIPAAEGMEEVNHSRLLRTDGGMAALGYHGFTCAEGHTCDDPRFEDDGSALLERFHTALLPFGEGWLGEDEGAPVAVTVGGDGFSTGERGDMDGDETITPADLLRVYDKTYPEVWRGWLRGRLVE